MIVKVFSLFDQSGPFVERAAKSLRILADKNGERILSKDHFCTVKVRIGLGRVGLLTHRSK